MTLSRLRKFAWTDVVVAGKRVNGKTLFPSVLKREILEMRVYLTDKRAYRNVGGNNFSTKRTELYVCDVRINRSGQVKARSDVVRESGNTYDIASTTLS